MTTSSVDAQGTLIPTHGVDMVFDHAGKYLYTTIAAGFLERYDLSTGQLDQTYTVGGTPWGMDITPDDSFVLIVDRNIFSGQGAVYRVDLMTGVVTTLSFRTAAINGWDIGIASNGRAFITTSGPFYELDLATNTITERTLSTFPNATSGGAKIARDETHKLLYLSTGFTYDALTDSFSDQALVNSPAVAVNRDRTLLATLVSGTSDAFVSLDTADGFHLRHIFSGIDNGVAFDPTKDLLYAATRRETAIIAYDTKTFEEQFRLEIDDSFFSIPHDFDGLLIASDDGRFLAFKTDSGIRLFAIPPINQITATPIPKLVRGMVFDHTGKYLYLGTGDGRIWAYDLQNAQLETSYNVGGSLNGLDIAPDDSFLLAAQQYRGMSERAYHKIDLHSGKITNLTYSMFGSVASWDVSIASNGLAFGTVLGADVPVYQINLATNEISIRTDVPGSAFPPHLIAQGALIQRSTDAVHLMFLDPGFAAPRAFVYDAATDSFGPAHSSIGVFSLINRNATLAVSPMFPEFAVLRSLPDFTAVHTFTGPTGGALAFDGAKDVLYGDNTSTEEIIGYNTNTFAENFRLNVGEDIPLFAETFGMGRMVASPSGKYLALLLPVGVRLFNVETSTPQILPLIPAPDGTRPYMIEPPPGATLTSIVTFRWTQGYSPTLTYGLTITDRVGRLIFSAVGLTDRSVSAALPVDGRDLLVKLQAFAVGGFNPFVANYLYKAAGSPSASSTPVISVSASSTQISEGSDTTITVSASPSYYLPLNVTYSLTGKAQNGIDYTVSGVPGRVTIPAGQTSATIMLHALTDAVQEKNETAKLKLNKGAGYKLSSAKKATVIIVNVP